MEWHNQIQGKKNEAIKHVFQSSNIILRNKKNKISNISSPNCYTNLILIQAVQQDPQDTISNVGDSHLQTAYAKLAHPKWQEQPTHCLFQLNKSFTEALIFDEKLAKKSA